MKRWILVGIVAIGVLGFWFLYRQRERANTERLVQQCEQDGASQEQFELQLPGGKPYRSAAYDNLAAKHSLIKDGNSRSEIRGLLGAPSYVRANVESGGVVYTSCYWAYVLQRSIEGERQVDDVVHAFFDPAGRVRSHSRKNEIWSTIHLDDANRLRKQIR